jgi:hypothetical protein
LLAIAIIELDVKAVGLAIVFAVVVGGAGVGAAEDLIGVVSVVVAFPVLVLIEALLDGHVLASELVELNSVDFGGCYGEGVEVVLGGCCVHGCHVGVMKCGVERPDGFGGNDWGEEKQYGCC